MQNRAFVYYNIVCMRIMSSTIITIGKLKCEFGGRMIRVQGSI